jgi:hypothetical protein
VFEGLFSPSFLVLLGGAGGFPGGGGAFPGGIGGVAGGVFLGLRGGLGGGGGALSAMTILYWQPEVLFERIGDIMSYGKGYAGYLINEIHGIGASFSIAPKPSSSITNKLVGEVISNLFVIELEGLGAIEKLAPIPCISLIKYPA